MLAKSNPQLFEKFPIGSRHEANLKNFPCRTELLRTSVFCTAPIIYNKLPKSIRAIDNLNEFKRTVKKFLVEKTYYKC